jgi:hypothetical protein
MESPNELKTPANFFVGDTGMILKYFIEGDAYLIRPELKEIAKKIKKDFMVKDWISKIKQELQSEEPNEQVLLLLKMKISSKIKQI